MTTPSLRTDAERNRIAILAAARSAFAEQGTAVRLDDIARNAGVGVATLYRRFPQRDDLVVAVVGDAMAAYADRAAVEGARSVTEPEQALRSFVLDTLEQQASDRAFGDVLIAPLTGWAIFVDEHRRARRSLERMVERARTAGAVRDDVGVDDLDILLLANAGVIRQRGAAAVESSRRLGNAVLDGLRVQASRKTTTSQPLRPQRP